MCPGFIRNIALGSCAVGNVGTSRWLMLPMRLFTRSTGSFLPESHAAQTIVAARAAIATLRAKDNFIIIMFNGFAN